MIPTVLVGASLAAAVTTTGVASWYANGPGLYAAAGPALRVGEWRGSTVTLAGPAGVVTLRLTDWMEQPDRLVDLSPSAFVAVCGDLAIGLCEVTVR